MKCHTSDDCSKDVGAECTENKFCKEPSWCNQEPRPDVYKVDTSNMRIWIKSAIQYIELKRTKMFISKSEEPILYPEAHFNTFTVKDLLLLCDPPVRYEEVSELGAAVEIQWVWDCNIDVPDRVHKCQPKIQARRVD